MKALFGTDGIRGEAGQFPLDPKTVSAIGFSLASHLSAHGAPEFSIGRDTRESGDLSAGAHLRRKHSWRKCPLRCYH